MAVLSGASRSAQSHFAQSQFTQSRLLSYVLPSASLRAHIHHVLPKVMRNQKQGNQKTNDTSRIKHLSWATYSTVENQWDIVVDSTK